MVDSHEMDIMIPFILSYLLQPRGVNQTHYTCDNLQIVLQTKNNPYYFIIQKDILRRNKVNK